MSPIASLFPAHICDLPFTPPKRLLELLHPKSKSGDMKIISSGELLSSCFMESHHVSSPIQFTISRKGPAKLCKYPALLSIQSKALYYLFMPRDFTYYFTLPGIYYISGLPNTASRRPVIVNGLGSPSVIYHLALFSLSPCINCL